MKLFRITFISAAGRFTRKIIGTSATQAENIATRLLPDQPRGFLIITIPEPL